MDADLSMRVTDLLRSPKALYFLACSTVGDHAVEDLDSDSKVELQDSELTEALDHPAHLLMTVFRYIHDWPYSDWRQEIGAKLVQHPDVLGEAAEIVARSSAAAWWWEPLHYDAQTDFDDVEAGDYRPGSESNLQTPLTKQPGGTVTSTRVDPLAGVALCGWDGSSTSLSIWSVQVRDDSRIFEIQSQRDWQTLTSHYNDWLAVSQDYDGVHLSMAGLLTVEALQDWLHEATVWLRLAFGEIRRLPDWRIELPYSQNDWPPPAWP